MIQKFSHAAMSVAEYDSLSLINRSQNCVNEVRGVPHSIGLVRR
jgi:hypothetical protein